MRDNLADIKITVLKKNFNKEIVDEFAYNPKQWTSCNVFEVGQEFIVSKEIPWDLPEDFCGWAWADIQKMVWSMSRGGPDNFVTCCTDGYRPVIFRIERI